jgi:hypothetical protein
MGRGRGGGRGGGAGRMGGSKAAGPGGDCVCPSCRQSAARRRSALLPEEVSQVWRADDALSENQILRRSRGDRDGHPARQESSEEF